MAGEIPKGGTSTGKGSYAGFLSEAIPWINVTAQIHDHAMFISGVPAQRFYSDARVFVDTMFEVGNYYNLESVLPFADVYNFEIEAIGGNLIFSENAMPTIDFRLPLIKDPVSIRPDRNYSLKLLKT